MQDFSKKQEIQEVQQQQWEAKQEWAQESSVTHHILRKWLVPEYHHIPSHKVVVIAERQFV
jgi:1,6-anhydro-N-acetylmuramate kinase